MKQPAPNNPTRGPLSPTGGPGVRGRVGQRARLLDRLGGCLIAGGGIGIIAAVLGIFVFVARETYPLFGDAEIARTGSIPAAAGPPLAVGVDPYREIAFAVVPNGLEFRSLPSGEVVRRIAPRDSGKVLVTAACHRGGQIALGLSDGSVQTGTLRFEIEFVDGRRVVTPEVSFSPPLQVHEVGDPPLRLSYRGDGHSRAVLASISAAGELQAVISAWRRSPPGRGEVVDQGVHDLTRQLPAPARSVVVDGPGRQLLAGTASGEIIEWSLEGPRTPPRYSRTLSVSQHPVTALEFLLGDLSLAVGDASGGLSVWFEVPEPGESGARRYRRIHTFPARESAITCIAPSARDRQFLTGSRSGRVALHHATSEQTFFDIDSGAGPVAAIFFAPKADGFLAGGGREVSLFDLSNPHPEISLRSLFGRVWYEGYPGPDYVWQSTGGTDEFEPKLSMVPLIFGTVKGTVYALLFALPLAVLAAIYTAEFARPGIRNVVKPAVEIMASLPSVILGFLAGLWLAPLLQHHVIGVAALLCTVPLAVAGASWLLHSTPGLRRLVPVHAEFAVLTAVTAAGSAVALAAGPALENMLFDGGFQHWLRETGVRYDQRNAIVIGFAMGFAVIPLIFTICEDSLSSVPGDLRAGSLALGATRWQTATRVVLPMAVPGLFSATMIGFGRAVGETMIVLMATGNTPIMDWSIFNGMRTISANIAVELPEAPHEGSLYRVLFLSGLLLFAVTFLLNTAAEGVRQRLRERYRRV